MFNRLKNFNLDTFLDSKIAEEQARQRQSGGAGVPSLSAPSRRHASATRRPNGRTASPSNRQGTRARDDADRLPLVKGPDPSEFVIDDDDGASTIPSNVPSRAPTPQPSTKKVEIETGVTADAEATPKVATTETVDEKDGTAEQTQEVPELPREVQLRLRKLQKMESKYSDLLRSYRIAHARISTIEPFEQSLREHTPLASINDPTALVEYLSQLSLKGDMVMNELKKVTEERNGIKGQLDEAERKLQQTDSKKTEEKDGEANGDDFFSYESEVPRLQDEMQDKVKRIDELIVENESLRSDLAELRESHATHSTPAHDAGDGQSHDDLKARLGRAEKEIEDLNTATHELSFDLEPETDQGEAPVTALRRLRSVVTALKTAEKQSNDHAKKLDQQLEQTKLELTESRDKQAVLARSGADDQAKSTERLKISEGLVETLKMQMSDAENVKRNIEQKFHELQKSAEAREKEFSTAKATGHGKNAEITELNERIKQQGTQLHEALALLAAGLPQSEAADKADIEELKDKTAADEAEVEVPAPMQTNGEGSKSKKKSKNKKRKFVASTVTSPVAQTPGGGGQLPANAASEPASLAAVVNTASKTSPDQIAKLLEKFNNNRQSDSDAKHSDLTKQLTEKSRQVEVLEAEIASKSDTIDRLNAKLKDDEGLQEEIEQLRDSLSEIGNEHVAAKDELKKLRLDKESSNGEQVQRLQEAEAASAKVVRDKQRLQSELEALQKTSATSSKDLETQLEKALAEKRTLEQKIVDFKNDRTAADKNLSVVEADLAKHRAKTSSLQTDLKAANELAQSRYKELNALKDRMSKIQPEINNMRNETERLKTVNEELEKGNDKLKAVESKSELLRSEVNSLKSRLQSRESEIKTITEKLTKSEERARALEEKEHQATRSQNKAEASQREASDARERLAKDMVKAKSDLDTAQKKVKELEGQVGALEAELATAKEDSQLKSAQHSSAQSLMDSMQDQTRELATQMKEVRARCDSLEEELADSQRLLMERSREGETMRRLLSDVEGRADARIKDMRERMDLAVEERDRAEEDASAVTRRRAREIDELRTRLKAVERQRDTAAEERSELERRDTTSEVARSQLERQAADAQREVEELRTAMSQLRDALDEGERQTRELERERAELRRGVEDKEKRLAQLQKGSRSMAEELKTLQTSARAAARAGSTTAVPASSRSSMDSSRTGMPASPARTGSTGGGEKSGGQMDYVYLKNVLLQFLEQRDKKHQMQLVPVLGMLLHFDGKDEQKWMTAINATK